MKKNQVCEQDLKILRKFLKEKRISLERLSKEMNYSTSHVIKVFRGNHRVQTKFLTLLLGAAHKILKNDLEDFKEFSRGHTWNTFT